jgi:hypothetical protein
VAAEEEDGVTAEAEEPSATLPDYEPRGNRYDELASVYGWAFVEKLGSLNYFMVGCGALGCEFLKVGDPCHYNHSQVKLTTPAPVAIIHVTDTNTTEHYLQNTLRTSRSTVSAAANVVAWW